MKKQISLLFLSVLFLQVAGGYVYFAVRLSGIRQEMREELKSRPDDELTLLTFTPDEFDKAKVDDHEIMVKGEMFDIARIAKKDSKILVYALHDEAEDNLLAFLNEIVKRSSKDKRSVPSSLIGFISLAFISPEFFLSLPDLVNENPNTAYHLSISEEYGQLLSPPPWSMFL